MQIDKLDKCPKCNARWKGEDIFKHFLLQSEIEGNYYHGKSVIEIYKVARSYGYKLRQPQYFSHLIGIEIRGQYDGISRWQCPKCAAQWCRWTNKEIQCIS